MKKIFPLQSETKKSERLVESIKSDIRKYMKRERAKKTPEGFHFWEFECRFGNTEASAKAIHPAELSLAIDGAHHETWSECYIEIIAKAAKKPATTPKVSEKK